MRIISKFSDYYDIGLSYGADNTIIYKRETSFQNITSAIVLKYLPELKSDGWKTFADPYLYNSYNLGDTKEEYYLTNFIVGVAGKIYSVYRLTTKKLNSELEINFYYGYDDKLNSIVEKYNKDYFYRQLSLDFTIKESSDIFIDYKVPVFIIERSNNEIVLTLNPKLSDIKFFKVLDSFSAYQEIASFISNNFFVENEMYQLSDPERIVKAGFDTRQSFRHRK